MCEHVEALFCIFYRYLSSGEHHKTQRHPKQLKTNVMPLGQTGPFGRAFQAQKWCLCVAHNTMLSHMKSQKNPKGLEYGPKLFKSIQRGMVFLNQQFAINNHHQIDR